MADTPNFDAGMSPNTSQYGTVSVADETISPYARREAGHSPVLDKSHVVKSSEKKDS